jgi:hypothetical protein
VIQFNDFKPWALDQWEAYKPSPDTCNYQFWLEWEKVFVNATGKPVEYVHELLTKKPI